MLDIGPYLYDLQHDSVYVIAVTSEDNDTLSVNLKDSCGSSIGIFVAGKGIRNTMNAYDESYGDRYTYKVLLPDLSANTDYIYDAAVCGQTYINNSFRTPPKPGDNMAEFKLGVWGDTQDVPLCNKAAPEILSFKPAALIHVGDFLNNGQRPEQLNKYLFGPAEELLRSTAIIPSGGNHDRGVDYWKDLFPTPRSNKSAYAGNLYYSYDIGNVHFVAIHLWLGLNKEYKELCLYNADTDPVSGDAARVLKMLEEDAASPSAVNARYRIITMHSPPINNTDWSKLLPYILKYDPSIIFFGHKHIYSYFTIDGTEIKAVTTGLRWDGDSSYTNVRPSFVEISVNCIDKETGKRVLKLSPYVWDGSDNAETGDFTLRPEDIIINPPEITGIPIVKASGNNAVISWKTDVPADDRIDYGTDRILSDSVVIRNNETEYRKEHEVEINDLKPGTTYFYRVKGKGINGDIGRSDIFTFTTKGLM